MRQGIRHRLKGIKVVTAPTGRRYVYRRVGDKLIPLPDLPENDEAFIKAYLKAAAAPEPRRATGSVEALVSRYETSDAWKALARGTQEVRRRILRHIVAARGAAQVAGLQTQHIRADLKGMAPVPANSRLKVWRALLAFAVEEEAIEHNPAAEIAPRPMAVEPHAPWMREHVEAFRDRWPIDTAPRMAMELLFWSGARCSDAVRLERAMIDAAGWLHFRQQKTGGDVSIPWTCDLPEAWASFEPDRQMLLACMAAHRGGHFILTEHGKPRSEKGMSQWFAERARDAGLIDLTAHGLRKSRAIEIIEAGGTHHQCGAWTGHTSLKEIDLYTRGANRRRILGFQRTA